MTDARAVPGVLEILTADSTSELREVKFLAGGGGATTSIQGLGPEIAHDGQIVAVVLAAKRLNRPVKLVATRDQGFTIATYRAETRQRIRMGASRDGKIGAFIHEGWEVQR